VLNRILDLLHQVQSVAQVVVHVRKSVVDLQRLLVELYRAFRFLGVVVRISQANQRLQFLRIVLEGHLVVLDGFLGVARLEAEVAH